MYVGYVINIYLEYRRKYTSEVTFWFISISQFVFELYEFNLGTYIFSWKCLPPCSRYRAYFSKNRVCHLSGSESHITEKEMAKD